MPTVYLFAPGMLGTDKRADASVCIGGLVERTAGSSLRLPRAAPRDLTRA